MYCMKTTVPLKLAYAIAIHKSQGITLSFVEIDCIHAYQPGQIGLNVGRAQNTDGFKVLNYRSSQSKTHPNIKFIRELSVASKCLPILNMYTCIHVHSLIRCKFKYLE